MFVESGRVVFLMLCLILCPLTVYAVVLGPGPIWLVPLGVLLAAMAGYIEMEDRTVLGVEHTQCGETHDMSTP